MSFELVGTPSNEGPIVGLLDWRKTRPRRSWVLVKTDPRVKQSKGGIQLPDSGVLAERTMEGTGVVLRIGSDVCDTVNFGLEAGMRICYRGFMKDASASFFEKHEDGCQVFMIHADDILAVIDEGVEMGAFS